MAFFIHSVDDGHVPSFEYVSCGAITPKVGMALKLSSGNLAIVGATDKPEFISMVEKDSACTAGDIIPVIRVTHDIVFETTNNASLASVNVGDKVTMHTDGLAVTATTTSGVAEITYKTAGTGTGNVTRVRF